MKQYTSNEQTAKLIELGFEKPKSRIDGEIEEILKVIVPLGEFKIPINNNCPAYSIGELIEMLPKEIITAGLTDSLSIYTDHNRMWVVEYSNMLGELLSTCCTELIDALYDMLVKLKRWE